MAVSNKRSKAIHQDDNVYLNTIVDEAIRHYYEYLKSNCI